MKKSPFLSILLCTSILSGCGADIASSSRKGTPTKEVPEVRTENTPVVTIPVPSHLHREKGSPVISYETEITQTLAKTLPEAYREIPNMLMDDEGKNNITTRDNLGRPTVICGLGDDFVGVATRIADCLAKNGTKATWNGNTYGAFGEAVWDLVSYSATGLETWRDNRTGMIWSDVLSSESNWCKASGNTQLPTAPSTTDCNALAERTSFCANNTSIDGIGFHIAWRLPTRNDYLQADLDGARFVLKKGSTIGSWTATMNSNLLDRSEAWVYNFTTGTLEAHPLTSLRQVRCIGVPKP